MLARRQTGSTGEQAHAKQGPQPAAGFRAGRSTGTGCEPEPAQHVAY